MNIAQPRAAGVQGSSGGLPADLSAELFSRSGRIRRLSLDLPRDLLLRSHNAVSDD
jgi:hypothetical protein